MNIITSINAKGGCGKSTIAMSLAAGFAQLGHATLLIDMDPQAQITQWLGLGDGLSSAGTIVEAMNGSATLADLIQPTAFANLSFVASAEGLEELGRQITDRDDYATLFTRLIAPVTDRFEFLVIDSPNQISPVMANAIYPTDLFIVPFESTKAVRSYANFYQLLLSVRPGEDHRTLHVMSNLTRQPGLRRRVMQAMDAYGIRRAESEMRTCGWLAQVDEHGGSILHWRPHSRGAADIRQLIDEVLRTLGIAAPSADTVAEQLPASATPGPEAPGPWSSPQSSSSGEEVPTLGTYSLQGEQLVAKDTPSTPQEIIHQSTNPS